MAASNGHGGDDSIVGFERTRIEVLKEERQYIQKKTFTKWINSYLNKVNMNVNDLFTDLGDGKMLLKLLEIISGEKIGKPSNGKMRVHKVENLNKSLAFLHTKVRLESIGAEDIVDGNPTLILGLIWTIILRFQIQNIDYQDEDDKSGEKKSAKEALLLWAQRKTHGYSGVKVDNFTTSWKNGLGFNALIHAHRPDLIEYDRLRADRPLENLNYAFDIAEKHLGIARLLDAEDILERPDEKSVMTYVSSYWHTFAQMKKSDTGGKRIAKIVGSLIEIDRLKSTYEKLCSDLLAWLARKTQELQNHSFPNNSDGLHQEFLKFKEYRLKEKPPRMMERGNIEVAFFDIQTKLKGLGQKSYIPPEGYSIQVVDKRWKELEIAEHQREMALREAMIRLERLERLAEKFERKALLRESWLKEMTTLLSDHKIGKTMAQIDASLKKFEAIKADIQPREDRFADLAKMAVELVKENYHGRDKIKRRSDDIIVKWRDLLDLLEKRRRVLELLGDLVQMVRDADSLYSDLKNMEPALRSTDTGQHLVSVHALLQKHLLTEAELVKIGKLLAELNTKAPRHVTPGNEEAALLGTAMSRLNEQYKLVQQLAGVRRTRLDEALKYYQFEDDAEGEDSWAVEKLRILEAMPVPKDSRQAVGSLQKAKSLESELNGRWSKVQMLKASGEGLISRNHVAKVNIQRRLQSLIEHWTNLRSLLKNYLQSMDAAAEFFQYHADANEIESWLKEAVTILSGMDPNGDNQDIEPLLRRHAHLEEEIGSYDPDIKRLKDNAARLQKAGSIILKLNEAPSVLSSPEREDAGDEFTEQAEVPQVVAMFPFKVAEFSVKKGEVLTLMEKATTDWWHVRRADGTTGTAPANHLKEVEPKVVKRRVAGTLRQLSKTGLPRELPSMLDPKYAQERQIEITEAFLQLKKDASDRRRLLGEAVGFRDFLRECGDMDKWILDQNASVFAENTDEPLAHQQKRYANFIAEFAARKKQLGELQRVGTELIAKKHHSSRDVRQLLEDLVKRWQALEHSKALKEKDLEYRSGMEAFDEAAKNATDYISEKSVALRIEAPVNRDIAAMKVLHKKISNFERELIPIQQMIEHVRQRGAPLKKQYPKEEVYIVSKEKQLQAQAQGLQDYLAKKRSELESDVSQSVFESALGELFEWNDRKLAVLNENPPIEDHKTASELRQQHANVADDIKTHGPEFDYVSELGRKTVAANPALGKEVKKVLTDLDSKKKHLQDNSAEKELSLEYVEQLLDLNRKVNRARDDVARLDSTVNEAPEVGTTHAEVETLLRRHEDLDRDLDATEKRCKELLRDGSKLVNEPPCNRILIRRPHEKLSSSLIKLQNDLKNYPKLRQQSEKRMLLLRDSLAYQSWKGDVEDLNQWMESLLPVMDADPSEEDIGSEKSYRRHAKQVAEIKANSERVQQLSTDGRDMIVQKHFASPKIAVLLEEMLSQWEDLTGKAEARNNKFEQAAKARGFYGNVDKARSRLAQIQFMLESKDGMDENADPRKLRTELKNAESNIKQAETVVDLVKNDAVYLAENNHFNGPKLIQTANALERQLNELRDPAKRRWSELDEIVKRNQVLSELEKEANWIEERLKLLKNPGEGKTLGETSALLAKLETVEAEVGAHEPLHKTVVDDGVVLAKRYPENHRVGGLLSAVKEKWQRLLELLPLRKQQLETAQKGHQYRLEYADANDWVEHNLIQVRNNPQVGKDAESTTKLREQNDQLARELQSEKERVDDLEKRAKALIQSGHPDAQNVANSQKQLRQKMDELEEAVAGRKKQLTNANSLHDFLSDCGEIEAWLQDQIHVAENTDCGINTETLAVTRQDFENFDKRISEFGPRRIKQIEEEAEKLRKRGQPTSTEVDKSVAVIQGLWAELNDAVERREALLTKMADIFDFDEQIAALNERMQEVYSLCHGDEDRDLKDVLIKLKRQDEADKEMKSIKALMDPLNEECNQLIEDFPGKDAEHVSEERKKLLQNWDNLRKALAQKRSVLEDLAAGHRWLNAARDLLKWGADTLQTMSMDILPKDKVSVDVLIQHHDDVKVDIVARNPDFEKLLKDTAVINSDRSPLNGQVRERAAALKELQGRLQYEWEDRRRSLDELFHVRKFLRDLDLLDASSAAQATYLQAKEPSDLTVDQIRKLISRHAASEKIIAQQSDKLRLLESHAEFLIQEHRIDPKVIMPRLKEVSARRKKIADLTKIRTERLHDALMYAEFNDIASDMDSWISEKVNHMRSNPIDELSFEDKIRKLIKHQTFEAELNSNAARIDYVKKSAGDLLRNRHEKSVEVDEIMQMLLKNWNNLIKLAAQRSKALDEAKDMVEFQNECDRTEKWMREKEQMLSAEDLGTDFEHCLILQLKLDDVGSDMKFDEALIRTINELADKLNKSGVGNMEAVVERRRSLNTNWENLHIHLDEYRAKLKIAKDLHALGSSVDDTTEMLLEKANGLTLEDAKDLENATTMIRKHESLMRDFDACVKRMDSLEKEIVNAHKLYPDIVKRFKLDEKMQTLRQTWQQVTFKIDAKKAHLSRVHALLRFLKEVQEFCVWSEQIQTQIVNGGLAQDSADAERLIEHHGDLKAQIQGREQLLAQLIQQSRGLSLDTTDAKDPANDAENRLRDTWNKLNAAWEQRSVVLRQCHEQQVFNELADQVDSWLTSKEAFLANEDLGSSMSEVESLLRKHNAFDNTIQRQSDKVTDLDKFSQRLIADNHYAKNDIVNRYNLVQTRLETIQKRSNGRKGLLEQSERYQQFFKSLSEFNAWMEEKFQLANDGSWKDPVHLENKLQKQASFDTELNANLGRMETLVNEGESMISGGHFAADDIRIQIEDLMSNWEALLVASADKKKTLLEVQRALSLNRRIEEFESWLDGVELVLHSEDIGSNLSTCLKLVEKTEATKFQVATEVNTLKDINQEAQTLTDNDHFLSDQIRDRLETVNKRYNKLDNLIKLRLIELEEAQKLHHFNLEHHEIVLWYKEKQTQLSSREVGLSLSEAQNLMRKIVQLEDEINEYNVNIQRTLETGCQLVASDTFATEQVASKLDELRDTYQLLKKQCSERKHILEESVESQKFYAEAYELESAFAQKKILLESTDTGDDEDSTKLLMKKLDAVDRDVHSFGKNVERLADSAESMRARNHFDALNVQRRFETLKDHQRELYNLVKHRRQQLGDGQKLFGFFEDCASLIAALQEKQAIADSEDYGTDVEHVDLLLQKFGNFRKGLSIQQIRVKNLNDKAQSLCNEGHPQVQMIKEKTADINDAWMHLQEGAHSRQEALLGAKEVHVFVRDCDETIGWIQERDAVVSSEEFGQDLESVQSLIRRHDGFQRDLAPFGQRVAQLSQEASNLTTSYPDTRKHVEKKHNEMQQSWHQLVDKSASRKERLHLAETVQSYLNKYREFSLWISEMLAIITSYEIPQDVRRAEALLIRHKEHKAEIDSRLDEYNQIRKEGSQVIQRGYFMADEIREKLLRLEGGYDSLCNIWKQRNELYGLNLDVQIFMRDCAMLQSWMRTQEPVLLDDNLGDSIQTVEELVRKHEDFQKTVENQEDRLNLVRRLTELEKAYSIQLSRETDARAKDRARQDEDKAVQKPVARMRERREEARSPDHAPPEPPRKVSVTRSATLTPSVLKKHQQPAGAGGVRQSGSFLMSKDEKRDLLHPRNPFKMRPDSYVSKQGPGEQPAPVDMEGVLERKQELEPGKQKATSRSWKTYYTVLCGQLLCFFKKRQASYEKNAASPPLNLYECIISQAHEYKKKDNAFRLSLRDGSEYLFAVDDEVKMREWMDKIQFHAALPPDMQLISYKDGLEQARDFDGDESTRALSFARKLPRNTPSPLSNGNSSAEPSVPVPRPRIRAHQSTSPEPSSTNGNGHASSIEVLNTVPESSSGENSERFVVQKRHSLRPDTVVRSESFGGDRELSIEERENTNGDFTERPRTVSSINFAERRNDGKVSRGATLPVGSSLGQNVPDGSASLDAKKGASAEKRGSRISLLGNMFKRHHDKDKG